MLILPLVFTACAEEDDLEQNFYAGIVRGSNVEVKKQSSGELVASGFSLDFWDMDSVILQELHDLNTEKQKLPKSLSQARNFKSKVRGFQNSLVRLRAQILNSGKETFARVVTNQDGDIVEIQIIDIDVVQDLIALFTNEITVLCGAAERYFLNQSNTNKQAFDQAKENFFFSTDNTLKISISERKSFIAKRLPRD